MFLIPSCVARVDMFTLHGIPAYLMVSERPGAVVFAILAVSICLLYMRIYHARYKQYATLPQLPTSLLWGHLQTFHAFSQSGPIDQHPDMVFSKMMEVLGRPPIIFADLRPVAYPMVVVLSHEIAEQVTRATKVFPQSLPKSETERHNTRLLGPKSILTAEGEAWVDLRKRFNPGFASTHLATLLPAILGEIPKLIQHLDTYAETGAEFSLGRLIGNLMFDIIGNVVMDIDLQAQNEPSRQGELIRIYRELLLTYANDPRDSPCWLAPLTELKRYRLEKRLNKLLRAIVYNQHSEQHAYRKQGNTTARARSILSLGLQDATELTPDFVHEICDQLKTFLFAGYDTSSSVTEWAFYELSRTPHALSALKAELNALLGPETDPKIVLERLLASGPNTLHRMKYTAAVFKEVLRLHPPAATARMAGPGAKFTLRTADGEEHCVDGANIYICHSLIQTDPAVYGDSANDFVPERWLDTTAAEASFNDGEYAATAKGGTKAPITAWRPFERGPRKCIGQEFAKIEAYAVLAVAVRRYEFVKTGLGELVYDNRGRPVKGKAGQYAVKSKLYQGRQITARPVDGMKMKVKLRSHE